MKRLTSILAMIVIILTASAQRLLIVNDTVRIALNDIERITIEKDTFFFNELVDGKIANDPQITIFSKALKLTGLADSIKKYKESVYDIGNENKESYEKIPFITQDYINVKWPNRIPTGFTVFVETDSIYRLNGINDIEDLKAYAKRIYDEVYPEDASINDPINRSNSLNRFVSYHILPFSASYNYIACNYKLKEAGVYNYDNEDIYSYYETMMPYSSLKVSIPFATNKLYLNRRGLKSSAWVAGAKVEETDNLCINGHYYYINDILTYGKEIQKKVFTERRTMDTKTMSPTLMNVFLHTYLYGYETGKGIGLNQNMVINFKADGNGQFICQNVEKYAPYYDGDGFFCTDMENLTIKLPPLPEGKWQIRMGTTVHKDRALVNTYIDDVLQCENIDMSVSHTEEDFGKNGIEHAPANYYYHDNTLDELNSCISFVVGTLTSDGHTDHFLRIEALTNYKVNLLDYFEFIPITNE